MLVPQPSNANKNAKHDRRLTIAGTIAQLTIRDHAPQIKHC